MTAKRTHAGILHDLTHNPITNVAGGVVQGLGQFPIDASSQIYNKAVAPALGTPNLSPQQVTAIAPAVKFTGATGSLHQTVASGLQTALTLGSGGLAGGIEKGVGAILPKTAAPIVTSLVPKVASNATLGAGFNAATAAGQGASPLQIAESAGVGGALGGALPIAGAAAKPVIRAAGTAVDNRVPLTEAGAINPKVVPEGQVVTPAEKATAVIKAQGTPESPVVAPKVIGAKTSMPEVNKAINDVAAEYATKANHAADAPIQDIVGTASNQSTMGARVANRLRKALSGNLSKEENTQTRDILDGHPGAWEAATPKAREVATALKPLHDQAFGLRQAIDPKVNRVMDYVTRLPSRAVGAAVKGSSDVMGKVRNLSDITNLRSIFSLSRQDGKFVGPDGKAVYGKPSALGLTQHQDGTITDASGKTFNRVAVSTKELGGATGKSYEDKISRLQGIYHTDSLSLKARAEALQALKDNPASHGLYTQQEVDAGALGGRTKAYPVDSVDELRTPEGKPYYAAKDDAQALSDSFGHPTLNNTPRVLKAYDAASNVAQQSIVINFLIHTMNEFNNMISAAGNLPGLKGIPGHGVGRVLKNVITQNEGDIRDFLANSRNHSSTFGSTMENALSRATNGKSKFNSKLMAAIELRFRTALYKSSLEMKMSPKAAADNVNLFFGDKKAINETVRRTVLFPHFLKTQAKIIYNQGRHPIQQRGSIANTVALAGALYGLDQAYKKFTGNPNANIGPRGELSLLKQGAGAVKGIINKDPSAVVNAVVGRANPVGKEIAQQAAGTDFFTGQKISGTKDRLGHAVSSTVAPTQTGGKVTSGKRSLVETVANQLNLNTPHAKGYQAAPNVPILNTKGAIADTEGKDPTGYQQQAAYFNNLNTLKKSVAGDTNTANALTKYLGRSHDPVTGQTIQNSPADVYQNASALATNSKLRGSIQKFEQSQPSHDPMWDLPASQLATLMTYKSTLEGSAERNTLYGNNPFIKNVEAAEQTFYANLPKLPGAKGSEANSATPTYPAFSPQTQSLLDAYDNGSADQKTALLQNYGSELSNAWQQKLDWTNKMRVAQAGKDVPQLKDYPVASPQVQAIMTAYDAVPKGGGPKGGNAYRAQWIQAHPQQYAQMQDYLTQASLSSLVKNASMAQFAGSTPSQTLLKDIKNVGQYDIASTKNADGTNSYSVNPAAVAAAYSGSATGGTSGSGSSSYKNTADYRGYKDAKTLSYTNRVSKVGGKLKGPKVAFKRSSKPRVSFKTKGASKGVKLVSASGSKLTPSKV